MKINKFSLAFFISVLAGCIFGFICFLSIYFFLNGDLRNSITVAIIIFCFLGGGFFFLKIKNTARRNFVRNALLEILFLGMYIFVAVLFTVPFAHYFTVFDRKKEIKEKIEVDLVNVADMFEKYETSSNTRIRRYELQLNAAIAGKDWNYRAYLSEGFKDNGESNRAQKNRFMKVFRDNLMPPQYDSTKKYATNALQYYKGVITNWVLPVRFLNVINKVEKESNAWLTELKGYDKRTTKAQGEPFDHSISFSSVKYELTQRAFPSPIAIAASILLNLLMLFPYFFAFRDPRNAGLINEIFKSRSSHEEGGAIL